MKMKRLLSAAPIALAALTLAAAAPMEWNVDAPHTGIEFSVKHFFTPVTGGFDSYDIELTFDREHPENSQVAVRIDVAIVNTGNEERDTHLQSEDFFGAERFGAITFRSEEVRMVGENRLIARGPLTIKDKTRTVELPITILGVKDIPAEMRGMLGGVEQIASFTAELELDRGDYGVGTGSWAANMVVGDKVGISIAVEANR